MTGEGRSQAFTVTVTDEQGRVVFVGRPHPDAGDFTLTREEGKPARLVCDVLDLSATASSQTP